jgi:hypothetical protein
MMARILQNTPGTISQPWYEDGVVVDPGVVTVTITRDDGTVLYTDAATSGTGTAARTYALTATDTSLLDILTATWESSTKGTQVLQVEVVGGFMFTIAEFRALGSAYASTTNYPSSRISEVRTEVEQELEAACGIPFVPRYRRETISGDGATVLLIRGWLNGHLPDGTPLTGIIRSATIGGVPVTLADVTPDGGGLYYVGGWARGYRNITVAYEHGAEYVPGPVKRAALLLAKQKITPGAADDRAINMTNESGTYALMQAGVRGHQFSIPAVQAVADAYDMRVGVA